MASDWHAGLTVFNARKAGRIADTPDISTDIGTGVASYGGTHWGTCPLEFNFFQLTLELRKV